MEPRSVADFAASIAGIVRAEMNALAEFRGQIGKWTREAMVRKSKGRACDRWSRVRLYFNVKVGGPRRAAHQRT